MTCPQQLVLKGESKPPPPQLCQTDVRNTRTTSNKARLDAMIHLKV